MCCNILHFLSPLSPCWLCWDKFTPIHCHSHKCTRIKHHSSWHARWATHTPPTCPSPTLCVCMRERQREQELKWVVEWHVFKQNSKLRLIFNCSLLMQPISLALPLSFTHTQAWKMFEQWRVKYGTLKHKHSQHSVTWVLLQALWYSTLRCLVLICQGRSWVFFLRQMKTMYS